MEHRTELAGRAEGPSAAFDIAAGAADGLLKSKRLLIVSHVVHFDHAGQLAAYGPYAREVDIWADLFEHVTIAAPLRQAQPARDCLPFTRPNITVCAQREAGGDTILAKAKLLASVPSLFVGLARAMRNVDAIHVRCPGNLGVPGVLLAPLFSRYLVAKYAGQWNGYVGESLAGKLQRRVLRSSWWRGPVTVYGQWPDQPPQVVPFFTSMMTSDQVQHAVRAAEQKRIDLPLRVLYSGVLERRKRVDALLSGVATAVTQGVPIELVVVGDGSERAALERQADALARRGVIRFVGALPYEQSLRWFEWAHCLVLPSRHSEGWPKVVAEGMCYGLMCVGVAHGQLPSMLAGRGVVLPTGSPDEIAAALRDIASNPSACAPVMRAASEWARQFSLDGLRRALGSLLVSRWNLTSAEAPRAAGQPMSRLTQS